MLCLIPCENEAGSTLWLAGQEERPGLLNPRSPGRLAVAV